MKTQFNNINLYMKNVYEKEKKLFDVLKKLNNFDFHSIHQKNELDQLNNQKNQLEIEKKESRNLQIKLMN